MARSFPIALNLAGKKCLVIGSTPEAAARARALAESDADVQIVSQSPCDDLQRLIAERRLQHHPREYQKSDLADCWLAVLTTRDPELASRIACHTREAGVFFCAVDQPDHSSFSHMAIARAGVVSLAIATNGKAPALARQLRQELERVMHEADLASFAEKLAELREKTPSSDRPRVLGNAVSAVHLQGRLRLARLEGIQDSEDSPQSEPIRTSG